VDPVIAKGIGNGQGFLAIALGCAGAMALLRSPLSARESLSGAKAWWLQPNMCFYRTSIYAVSQGSRPAAS